MKTVKYAGAIIYALLLITLAGMPCFAQSGNSPDAKPAWLMLESGKLAYENKNFGVALMDFDNAISERRNAFSNAASRLGKAMESDAGKAGNDSIRKTLAAFAEEDFLVRDYDRFVAAYGATSTALFKALRKERLSENHRAFIEVLLMVLEYRSLDSLDDSISSLRTEVSLLSRYPEAEYWKGKVFFVEGELAVADTQYRRAFDMRASLEIPEERYTILYSMAEIYQARSDFIAWENIMKSILNGGEPGTEAKDAGIDPYLRDAMMSTLQDSGFDRFMTLYRLEPSNTLAANAALAKYYLERGRAAAALHAAIAANMSFTRILSMIEAKDREYTWKGLDDFLAKLSSRKDIASYLQGSDIPELMLVLADSLYIAGSRKHAAELWRFTIAAGVMPFKATAETRLANPGSAIRRSIP
jgi:tetratricopeptide (TPR) repeat protein